MQPTYSDTISAQANSSAKNTIERLEWRVGLNKTKWLAVVKGKRKKKAHFSFSKAKGVIPMTKKKPEWNKMKAEYISGNISQQELADKYGVPYPTLRDRANEEKWADIRKGARNKAIEKTIEKAVAGEQIQPVLL